MTNVSSNVVAARPNVGGGVYAAPTGTALPTDSTTALAVAFLAAGYVSNKGVTEKIGITTAKVVAWGGDTVKVSQNGFEVQYDFELLETLGKNANVLAYGAGNVVATAPTSTVGSLIAAKVTSLSLPKQVLTFDMIDGVASIRIVLPSAQVTAIGNTQYSDGGAALYPLTITAYPDASGVCAYKYMNDGIHI